MARKNIQFLRGSEQENNDLTGPVASLSMDLTNTRMILHNGVKKGGFPFVMRHDLASTDPSLGAALIGRGVISVDSVQELRNLPSAARRDDLTVIVKSYYGGFNATLKGPEGGGEFKFDSTRSTEDDGGSVILGWVRKVSDFVTPEMFGARGDADPNGGGAGVANGADDITALNSARDFAASAKVTLSVSNKHLVSAKWVLSESNLHVKFLGDAAIIPSSHSLLVGVEIGGSNMPTRMDIDRLKVDRGAYNGVTENIGIQFLAVNQSELKGIESRRSKYPIKVTPDAGGFAYNNIYNLQAIGGLRNLWMSATGTGFANENKFYGGRFFDGGEMEFQIYLDGGQVNNNHFYGPSCEGSGISAIYCNGIGNLFIQPRFEGIWSVAPVEFGPDSLLNWLQDNSLYGGVIDNSTNTSGNRWDTSRAGSNYVMGVGGTQKVVKRTGASLSKAAYQVEDLGTSGDNYVNEWRHVLETAESYVYRSIRESGNLVRSSLTTDGKQFVEKQYRTTQTSWVFQPIKLGTYGLWLDGPLLRKKGGDPTSATDGAPLMEGQTSVPIGFNNSANIVNAAGKYTGKMVFDTSTSRPVWATGALATSPWVYADGTVAYSPA